MPAGICKHCEIGKVTQYLCVPVDVTDPVKNNGWNVYEPGDRYVFCEVCGWLMNRREGTGYSDTWEFVDSDRVKEVAQAEGYPWDKP